MIMKRYLIILLLFCVLSTSCFGIPDYHVMDIVPSENNTINLGSPTQYYNSAYISNIYGVSLGGTGNVTTLGGTPNTVTKFTGANSVGDAAFTEGQVSGAIVASHAQNTDTHLTSDGVTIIIDAGVIVRDLYTDRWIYANSNTLFGIDVAGLGVLSHTGGQEGWFNTFYGNNAGRNTTTGYKNTYIGESAGYRTTTGFYNTFIGADVGSFTTTGQYNTALGYQSFNLNTLGSYNTAIGLGALASLDSGNYNTAVGLQSLN